MPKVKKPVKLRREIWIDVETSKLILKAAKKSGAISRGKVSEKLWIENLINKTLGIKRTQGKLFS